MASTKKTADRVVIMAFQGWNDAADAATGVVDYLAETYPTEMLASTDSEVFFDYQVTRPGIVVNDSGVRELIWPSVTVEMCKLPRQTLMLISGPEPNLRWREFALWIDKITSAFRPTLVVLLGAMLSDAPHSRPFEVSGTAPGDLVSGLELEPNDYEGPTGIVGVLTQLFEGIDPNKLVTMWVSVPHYTAPPPNPKASLALLERVELLLGVKFDLAELRENVASWEAHINELIDDDPEMAEYVESLENQTDAETVPKGTGDSLAAAFEDYLLRNKTTDG